MHAPVTTVRIAAGADHNEIWRLFMQAHLENGLFKLAPEKVEWFLQRALFPQMIAPTDTGTRGLIAVIGPIGALEAIAFLMVGEVWYSNERHIGDCLIFVDPKFRKTNHGRLLLDWMLRQQAMTGLPLMSAVVSTVRTEAKCRLYARKMQKVGEFYLARPATALSS